MQADLGGLDSGQRLLWPELAHTPPEFILYGGVALTLRFRHRHSADFDFFCWRDFDPQELLGRVPYLEGARVLQMSANTLTCLVERKKPIKLSYLRVPKLGRVGDMEIEDQIGLRIASLLDVAATKASVIQKRAASRDYIDMYLLLTEGKLALPAILSAAATVYGPVFNPHITLKAMSYFADGDLSTLSEKVKLRLQDEVHRTDLENFSG